MNLNLITAIFLHKYNRNINIPINNTKTSKNDILPNAILEKTKIIPNNARDVLNKLKVLKYS